MTFSNQCHATEKKVPGLFKKLDFLARIYCYS